MNGNKDYYQILGIPRDAQTEDIRRAYRQLAREFHPDLNSDPRSADRMREINEAYEVLSDPDKRARYDQFGTVEPGAEFGPFTGGFGDFGLGDIFETFFGGAFPTRTRERGPVRGADLKAQVRITLLEAATGTEKEIVVPRLERCSACNGTGAEASTFPAMCSRCNGKGELRQVNQSLFGQFIQVIECPDCGGEGTIIRSPCPKCRGSGLGRATHRIKVRVPPGADETTKIRLTGEGEAGPRGGSIGDLYVYFTVEKDPRFERSDADLLVSVAIPYPTLVLGGTVQVPHLMQEQILEIPPGTESGARFRLRGKGLPLLGKNQKGDLIITVKVEIPSALDEEERELLEKLQSLKQGGKSPRPKKGGRGLFRKNR